MKQKLYVKLDWNLTKVRRFSGKGFKLLNIKPRNWVYLAAARATGEGEQCQGQGTMPGMGDGRPQTPQW